MDRFDAFDRDFKLFLNDIASPEARSRMLAEFAAEQIAEVKTANRAVTGADVQEEVIVDGRKGGSLASVRPDGVIVANFDPFRDILEWIGEQLILESPRLTGRYSRSHVMEIDGVEWDNIGAMPDGDRFVFFNTTPYARKIEPRKRVISERAFFGDRRKFKKHTKTDVGQSSQAPDGVYHAIAAVARKRFSNIARITYSVKNYRSETGLSHPAIIVRRY